MRLVVRLRRGGNLVPVIVAVVAAVFQKHHVAVESTFQLAAKLLAALADGAAELGFIENVQREFFFKSI